MLTASILLPVVGLAVLWAAGLGAADLVGKRMAREARAALAPLLAAAVLVAMSPLALVGVRPLVLVSATLGLMAALTALRARSAALIVRKAGWPAVVAVLALVLSAAPALRNGTWAAATSGNVDPYVWVSQARALNDGPTQGPVRSNPDRVVYDLLTKEHWPTGLPVGLAEVAALEGVDPVSAYEVFATMLSSLLALAVFFGARACLRWSPKYSALVGGVISANGLILLSAYYGWQAQVLLTTFGTLTILTLPMCFDRRSRSRELLLPALFAAAGVATYGWTFSAFVGMALGVVGACWITRPRSSVSRPKIVLRAAAVAGLTLVIGFVPIFDALRSYAGAGGSASSVALRYWNQYDWGLPSDALGLVVRLGVRKSPGGAWAAFVLLVAVALLGAGVARMRAFRNPRGHVVVGGTGAALIGLAILAATHASPYMSLKLMAYSAPLLSLTALSAFVPRGGSHSPRRPLVALGQGSALLFVGTTALTVALSFMTVRPATSLGPVVAAAEKLPRAATIRIDYAEGWRQMWLVYFLRDRRLAVPRPSVTLVGYSASDAAKHRTFADPAAYAIAPDGRRPAVWRGSGVAIYALRPRVEAHALARRRNSQPSPARPRSTDVKTIRDRVATTAASAVPMRPRRSTISKPSRTPRPPGA
jgi:hypothetical protein